MALVRKLSNGDAVAAPEPKKTINYLDIGDYETEEFIKALVQADRSGFSFTDVQFNMALEAIRRGDVSKNADGSWSFKNTKGLNNQWKSGAGTEDGDGHTTHYGYKTYNGIKDKNHGIFTSKGTRHLRELDDQLGSLGLFMNNVLSTLLTVQLKEAEATAKAEAEAKVKEAGLSTYNGSNYISYLLNNYYGGNYAGSNYATLKPEEKLLVLKNVIKEANPEADYGKYKWEGTRFKDESDFVINMKNLFKALDDGTLNATDYELWARMGFGDLHAFLETKPAEGTGGGTGGAITILKRAEDIFKELKESDEGKVILGQPDGEAKLREEALKRATREIQGTIKKFDTEAEQADYKDWLSNITYQGRAPFILNNKYNATVHTNDALNSLGRANSGVVFPIDSYVQTPGGLELPSLNLSDADTALLMSWAKQVFDTNAQPYLLVKGDSWFNSWYVLEDSIDPQTDSALRFHPATGSIERFLISTSDNQFLKDLMFNYYVANVKNITVPTNKIGGILKLQGGKSVRAIIQNMLELQHVNTHPMVYYYNLEQEDINNEKKRVADHVKQELNDRKGFVNTVGGFKWFSRPQERAEAGAKVVGNPFNWNWFGDEESVDKTKPTNFEGAKPIKWTTNEKWRAALIAMDAVSLASSLIPGYGTAVSLGTGAASTLTGFGVDLFDDSVSTREAFGNLGLGLGLDLAGALPYLGVAAKAAKIGKMVKPMSTTLKWAARTYLVGQAAANYKPFLRSISKLSDPSSMTLDDWRDFTNGMQIIASGMQHTSGSRRVNKAQSKNSTKRILGKDGKYHNVDAEKFEELRNVGEGLSAKEKLTALNEWIQLNLNDKFEITNPFYTGFSNIYHRTPKVHTSQTVSGYDFGPIDIDASRWRKMFDDDYLWSTAGKNWKVSSEKQGGQLEFASKIIKKETLRCKEGRKILKGDNGIVAPQAGSWLSRVGNNSLQRVLDRITELNATDGGSKAYVDIINGMQGSHAKLYNGSGFGVAGNANYQGANYWEDPSVRTYQLQYQDEGFNEAAIWALDNLPYLRKSANSYNQDWNNGLVPRLGVDGKYAAITDDRRVLGRNLGGDDYTKELLDEWNKKFHELGWNLEIGQDGYYRLNPFSKPLDPQAETEPAAPVIEGHPAGGPKPVQPGATLVALKLPTGSLNEIYSNLTNGARWDNLVGLGRVIALNEANTSAAKQAMDWDPALKSYLHRLELLQGNYQALKEAQEGRARLASNASRRFTADASLQLAGELTSTDKGNLAQFQAAGADALKFYETQHKILDLANQDKVYNLQVGDYNRGVLADKTRFDANIKANLITENANNWDNYFMGIQKQLSDGYDRLWQFALGLGQMAYSRKAEAIGKIMQEKYKVAKTDAERQQILNEYNEAMHQAELDYGNSYYNAVGPHLFTTVGMPNSLPTGVMLDKEGNKWVVQTDKNGNPMKNADGTPVYRPYTETKRSGFMSRLFAKSGAKLSPTELFIMQSSKDFNKALRESHKEFYKNIRAKNKRKKNS